MANAKVQVRRAYEDPAEGDGTRVLVDRIWPRGLTRARAALDEWCKEIAPSTELRKWYGHDPERFEEFGRRHQAELADPERAGALAHLRELASGRGVTLLTATRQPEISEAAILARLLWDWPSVGDSHKQPTRRPWLLGLSRPAGCQETEQPARWCWSGRRRRKPGGAARAGVQAGRDTRHQCRGELGDQRRR
jgi:uncharacterized protein YeaO (DUF488 family)